MKKVLFDLSVCQPIGNSKFHGGGVYGYIVFEALANKYPNDIMAYYDGCRYLPEIIKSIIHNNNVCVKTVQEKSILELYQDKEFTSIYSSVWSKDYYTLLKYNVPIIATIHGLRVLEMNKDSYESIYVRNLRDFFKVQIKKTRIFKLIQKKYHNSLQNIFSNKHIKFVTVSEHSKASIKYYYPNVDSSKIKVFYSPNTSISINNSQENQEKYYLIVSANRWLKNAYRAILALDNIFQNQKDFFGDVIVTGITENSKLFGGLKNRDRFSSRGYMERDELENLYKNAYALIYPSLNEGFGYPPIEAMKYGVPVIASSFASISEICGNAPLYVNPYSIDEIGMRILELEDPHIYNLKKKLSESQYAKVKHRQEEDLVKLIDYIMT
ncbi:MAG: glycosyltransferase [Ruminococcus sp.]|nr:glycosyltransferase [Ruminococcus sp.]